MAGIYIKGMEMPKEGHIIVHIYADGKVCEPTNCVNIWNKVAQAISVPPHGDLIDRYNLKNKKITIDYDEWDDTFDDGLLFVTDLIDNAPTIIPADPPVMYYPQVPGITPTVIAEEDEEWK